MKLSELEINDTATVVSVNTDTDEFKRLTEIGFVKGVEVIPLLTSLTKGLRAYSINNTMIALRDRTADNIYIIHNKDDLV